MDELEIQYSHPMLALSMLSEWFVLLMFQEIVAISYQCHVVFEHAANSCYVSKIALDSIDNKIFCLVLWVMQNEIWYLKILSFQPSKPLALTVIAAIGKKTVDGCYFF